MMKKTILSILLIISGAAYPQTISVKHYTIDSSSSREYAPLAIPRFQLAPLSGAGDLAIYMGAGFPTTNTNFYMTYNLDSTTRWVNKYAGISYPLDHAHISVYNDTIYVGKTNDNLFAFGVTNGDSLTRLFQYDWNATDEEIYIASVWRLPGSDTAIAVTRGYSQPNDNNLMYRISTDRGQSWGSASYLADWSSVAGRVRIGGLIYNNTLAIVADSNDQSIVWFTWNRATRSWSNDGRVFNRTMYRGYAGNSIEDTIRFIVGTRDLPTGDSIICAYRNRGAAGWTEGPAFLTSSAVVGVPPYSALTYIESSKRLVLFYTKSDYASDDSVDIYMRYWNTTAKTWSSPTKVSRGRYSWKVTTACRVPASHGDVCYAAYPMDTTIGGTEYHFADLVKVSFQTSDDTIPPGKINDLGANPLPEYGQIQLSWTAPGDDGYVGAADNYIIKYGGEPIAEENFGSMLSITNPPEPSSAGTRESCLIAIPTAGDLYYFAIKSVDAAGNPSLLSNVASASLSPNLTDNYTEEIISRQIQLKNNYPNPFNGSTRIDYNLAFKAHVQLSIHDILGREINTLVDGILPAGNYAAVWDGDDADGNEVASGVYFYRMKAVDFVKTRKMMMLK